MFCAKLCCRAFYIVLRTTTVNTVLRQSLSCFASCVTLCFACTTFANAKSRILHMQFWYFVTCMITVTKKIQFVVITSFIIIFWLLFRYAAIHLQQKVEFIYVSSCDSIIINFINALHTSYLHTFMLCIQCKTKLRVLYRWV